MSRSGYDGDGSWGDIDHLRSMGYRQAVRRSIEGKRGQAFLRDLLAALDAMPGKKLKAQTLIGDEGCCALGSVAQARGLDVSEFEVEPDREDDPAMPGLLAAKLGIAESLACEVMYENDDVIIRRWLVESGRVDEREGERWTHVRAWVASQIKVEVNL